MKKSLLYLDGKWWYVGGSGPGNYTTIQSAIDNASVGDTVFVYDESSPYYEDLFINTSIMVIGENRDTTIIDGDFISDGIKINSDAVTIKNFVIQNCKLGYSAISVRSDNNIIDGNIFTHNYIGILFLNHSANTIVNNSVFLDNQDGIVFMENSQKNLVLSCDFLNNTGGICFFDGHRDSKVTFCYFSRNKHDIEADRFTLWNKISYNNFMGTGIIKHWWFFNFNLYSNNYWYDWCGMGPYLVCGFCNWDWHPAQEPYDIP